MPVIDSEKFFHLAIEDINKYTLSRLKSESVRKAEQPVYFAQMLFFRLLCQTPFNYLCIIDKKMEKTPSDFSLVWKF